MPILKPNESIDCTILLDYKYDSPSEDPPRIWLEMKETKSLDAGQDTTSY
jgi:uncharacterized Zn-finger protein